MSNRVFHLYETDTYGRILGDGGPIDVSSDEEAVALAAERAQQEHKMFAVWANDRLVHVTPPPSILKTFDPDA